MRTIYHQTIYSYASDVGRSYHQAWLIPRTDTGYRLLEAELTIEPAPRCRLEWLDYFGNRVVYFEIMRPHRQLLVTSRFQVSEPPFPDWTGAASPAWDAVALALAGDPALAAVAQFTLASPLVPLLPALAAYAAPSFPPGRPLRAALRDLLDRILAEFRFDATATSVKTTVSEVLAHRRGVCQDFAHLTIGCLRSLGLAARYVSGYIETRPPPGRARRLGADASHAWVSVFCPSSGWIDIDPTNGLLPADELIPIAWGRDYRDVCPLQGVIFGGGAQRMTVAVDVLPAEHPRPDYLHPDRATAAAAIRALEDNVTAPSPPVAEPVEACLGSGTRGSPPQDQGHRQRQGMLKEAE